jgi:hypothetical protein
MDLRSVTHLDFEPLRNQRFRIEDEPRAELELVSVDVRSRFDPSAGTRRPFALLFRGPKEPILTQRIYALSNPSLPGLEIFLVPVGPDDAGMLYEAVFT